MKSIILTVIISMSALTVYAQDGKPVSVTEEVREQVKTTITQLHKVDKKVIASISKNKDELTYRLTKYKGLISKDVMAKLKKGGYDKVIQEQFKKQKNKKILVFRFQLMAHGVHDLVLTYKRSQKGKKTILTLTKLEQFNW